MCPSPTDGPCEWIGARGVAESALVVAGHLLVVPRVSADNSDPFDLRVLDPSQMQSSSMVTVRIPGQPVCTVTTPFTYRRQSG